MEQISANILNRIRKMLALAKDGGATEGEASNALAMAQRIAQENNLSIATIEASGGPVASNRKDAAVGGRAMYKWQQQLMKSISEVNFCYCEMNETREDYKVKDDWGDLVTRHRWVKRGFRLIGREDNVASAQIMFEYLLTTINRLVLDFVGGDNAKRMTKPGVAFAEGCSDRLQERLDERHVNYLAEQARQAREANAAARHPASTSTSNAMVVVMEDFAQSEDDLNHDYKHGLEPGTTAKRRAESRARGAVAAAQNKAKADAARAEGHPERVCWLIEIGYSLDEALKRFEEEQSKKPETEAQARKRREKQEREEAKYRRQAWREALKRDWVGYEAGRDAGAKVNLDRQIDKERQGRIGGDK